MTTTSSATHDMDVDLDRTPISTSTTPSTFRKTVTLYDWWLIKSEKDYNGRILAVGGSTSEGNSAIRILSSAPIVKRYDMVTLETADRMRIILKGYINRTRTHENGFSSEVYDRLFLIGFPSIWEHFSYQCEEGINLKNVSGGWDEHGSPKGGESKINLSKEISEDPLAASVSQVTAKFLGPSDIELHKTENTSNESKVEREVVSENLMNKLSFNSIDTFEDHLVPTGSSVSTLKVDKDNYGEKASPYMRSIERAKYLNSRLKEIRNSKMKSSNLCDPVIQDNVNDVVTPVGKKSCVAKSSSLYNVDIAGTTRKVILPSPRDSPEVFVTPLSCSNETARQNMSKDSLLCSDVNSLRSSEENMVSLEEKNDLNTHARKDTLEKSCRKRSSGRNSCGKTEKSSRKRSSGRSSCGETGGKKESITPVELRRSSRISRQ
ncbi:Embryo defective [Thalictrum thalictroides]|uniref:Embryo defective n=1 Tax=Thalictrum thalictroides TaxID=46969 RepID=A0A7J6WMZ8_THATH|nr:Embryo defective [Thalictrum thalictroides]